MKQSFYRTFIQPRSRDPDSRRREAILNVLLSGLAIAATTSFIATLLHVVLQGYVSHKSALVTVPAFTVFMYALLWLSRRGYSTPMALLLLVCVYALATYHLFVWSFALPATQLLFVLSVVLAGVLFRARAAIISSILVSLTFLIVAVLQVAGYLTTNSDWLSNGLDTIDAVSAVIIFLIVGLVTWLANTEIDRALVRARTSEASLAKERNSLEVKVRKRTKELEEVHLLRLMELQRFAELGKLSAGLLHDVASPLTAATINIGRLDKDYKPRFVRQAAQSLHYIERYVEAARKQLLAAGEVTNIKVSKEVSQVASIVSHQAKINNVSIKLDIPTDIQLHGDPVKFSQVVANLAINAIEAYDDMPGLTQNLVHIMCRPRKDGVTLSVHDNGKGLSTSEKSLIFQSFYTTKSNGDESRNIGIGLPLVRHIVEQDFGGHLRVTSSPRYGTKFTAKLFNVKG